MKFLEEAFKADLKDEKEIALRILVHSMVLNIILTNKPDANLVKLTLKTLHHIREDLKSPMDSLHRGMMDRIYKQKKTATISVASTSAGSSAPAEQQDAEAEALIAAVAATGNPKKKFSAKKMRRF